MLSCSFFHDLSGVLAGVHQLALVTVELLLDGRLCIPHIRVAHELLVAMFTDSKHWDISDPLHDPKITLWHIISFPQGQLISQTAEIQTAPLALSAGA